MPVKDGLRRALGAQQVDEVHEQFEAVWGTIEGMLEAFARLTGLRTSAILNGVTVYQSRIEDGPEWCAVLRRTPTFADECAVDDLGHFDSTPTRDVETSDCYAGLQVVRRHVTLGSLGRLTLLAAGSASDSVASKARRDDVLTRARRESIGRHRQLVVALKKDQALALSAKHIGLLEAMADSIQLILNTTVGLRALTIHMAHELSATLLGVGLLAYQQASQVRLDGNAAADVALPSPDPATTQHILHESQLGLYIVRNFLSHASESRYRKVVRPQFASVSIDVLVAEMVELYKFHAAGKQLLFNIDGIVKTPPVMGVAMELRRLFHNVLSNAVKYSYRSVAGAPRSIRLWTRSYDPGFKEPRIALSIENYGLGVGKEELPHIMKAGYRGRAAIAEVPNGAGIGLFEAQKIMKLHKGEIRLRSEDLHEDRSRGRTHLTIVDLIFPVRG